MNKMYHLSTHFKERLIATLPATAPFKCPDCEHHEAKTRINLWTHYLGKHNYYKKWAEEEMQLQGRKNHATNNFPNTSTAKTSPAVTASDSVIPPTTDQIKTELKTEMEIQQNKGIAPGSFEVEDKKSLDSFKKEVSQELELKNVNMHGIRGIELSQLDGNQIIKKFGNAEINKNNGYKEGTDQLQQMPITPKTTPKAGRPQTQSNSVEFWCDLCQKLIKFVAKWNHYASIHFESRLRKLLPNSEPFLCVYCNHIGKDLMKLTNHFLNRHDVLEEWIREEFEVMEDEIIAKSNNDLLEIPPQADFDFEEVPPDDDDDHDVKTVSIKNWVLGSSCYLCNIFIAFSPIFSTLHNMKILISEL